MERASHDRADPVSPVIDTHQHFWDPATGWYDWMTGPLQVLAERYAPDDLAPLLQRHGVDGTVLVQAVGRLDETRRFLALAAQTPFIRAVVGWVDLTDPAVSDRVAALRAGPGGEYLVGFRHQVQDEPDPAWLSRADVRRGLTAVRDAGMRYELLVNHLQMPAAVDTVRTLPDLAFILDHVGKPPIASGEMEPWAARIAALAAEPNVVCKFSGMATQADWQHWTTVDLRPYAEHVLRVFGPDRLMYGSDWPFCHLAATYDQQFQSTTELLAGLTEPERTAIMGGTAVRAYGLDSTS
jgi:L-fuconolactonase